MKKLSWPTSIVILLSIIYSVQARESTYYETEPDNALTEASTLNALSIDQDASGTDITDTTTNLNATDVASSKNGAIVTNMLWTSTDSYNQPFRAIDDNADDPYYGKVKPEQPGEILFPKAFKLNAIDIYLQLSEKNESFRFSLESTVDGENWKLLKDYTDRDYQGLVRVELDNEESAAIRLVAKSSTVNDILQVNEVNAFTNDHVPDFKNNLALSRFGGEVIEATEEIYRYKQSSSLLNGVIENTFTLSIGEGGGTIIINLAGNKPVYIDAVQLISGHDSPPSTFEVFCSATDSDDDFNSIGTFSFSTDHARRLAVLETPRPARRIKIVFPKTVEWHHLGEIQVFESVAQNASSILDTIALRSAGVDSYSEPIKGKDLAHPHQGVALIKYPDADSKSLEEFTRKYKGTIKQFPATFELGFYGEKTAKLEQSRFYIDGSSGDIKLNVYAINGEETTLVNRQPLLVPEKRGWWKTPLYDVDAGGIQIEFVVDSPNEKTHLKLEALQVVEASMRGYTSILEAAADSFDNLGVNIALSALGGKIVHVSSQYPSRDWDAENLIDGRVNGPYQGEGSSGWESEEHEIPVVTLSLASDKPTNISGIGINSTVPRSGFLDVTDVRWMPVSVEIAFTGDDPSSSTASWSEYSKPYVLAAVYNEQYIPLPEARKVKGVRLRFPRSHGAEAVAVGEIAVYETKNAQESIVNQIPVDVLQPALGGKLVRRNAKDYSNDFSAANILGGALTLSTENPLFEGNYPFWAAADNSPDQSFIFAFKNWNTLRIKQLFIAPPPADYREGMPVKILVEGSGSENPLDGYRELGIFSWKETSKALILPVETDTPIRFLKLTIVDTQKKKTRATLGPISVEVYENYKLLTENPIEEVAVSQIEETVESRSTQLGTEHAIPVSLASNLKEPGDHHQYQFSAHDENAGNMRINLSATRASAVNVIINNVAGDKVLDVSPSIQQREFNVQLAPGSYTLEVHRPHPKIVAILDDSGSMEYSVDDVRKAVRAFINSKQAKESVELIKFSDKIQPIQSLTDDKAELVSSFAKNSLKAKGGTALYDGLKYGLDQMGNDAGDKVILLLSDGADSASEISYFETWNAIEGGRAQVYSIALGSGMGNYNPAIGLSPKQMLEAWGKATGGEALETNDSEEVLQLFASIRDKLRQPVAYTIDVKPEDRTGFLKVVLPEQPENTSAIVTGASRRIGIILDSSGSMAGTDSAGKRRNKTAYTALEDVLSELPDGTQTALIAYGHRYPRKPKEKSCQDIETLVPFASLDRKRLLSEVKSLTPKGQTPIGGALKKLSEIIENDTGSSYLALVITDGEEKCAESPDDPLNPLNVVKQLKEKGIRVTVNIVGFGVKDKTIQHQLSEVAAETGGAFFYASETGELTQAMAKALAAEFVVLDMQGNEVHKGQVGGDQIQLPVGQYRVEVDANPKIVKEISIEADEAEELVLESVKVSTRKVTQVEPEKKDMEAGARSAGPVEQEEQPGVDSTDDRVRSAQRWLKQLGFTPGPADGLWGRTTEAALREFQHWYPDGRLNATGQLDGKTYLALESAANRGLKRSPPPRHSKTTGITEQQRQEIERQRRDEQRRKAAAEQQPQDQIIKQGLDIFRQILGK
ncbi:MAG: VWA domain-containing protein [Pseudomonadota bacterium]